MSAKLLRLRNWSTSDMAERAGLAADQISAFVDGQLARPSQSLFCWPTHAASSLMILCLAVWHRPMTTVGGRGELRLEMLTE